jgi:hypothetical protein
MLDKNKPIAVIVNGPSRVGKSTALQYLRDTYGSAIAVFEPGRALKIHYMLNIYAPKEVVGLRDDYEAYLYYMRTTQDHWVSEYEKLKADGWVTREMIILYAESIRAVYKDFWIDLAAQLLLLTEDTKLIWSESINQLEFWPLKDRLIKLVGGERIATVRLECENPAEIVVGDTRTPITQCKNVIKYRLEDSIQVAESIFNNREGLVLRG